MRRIDITKVSVDSIVGENIYTDNGVCLIAKGGKLTSRVIDRLTILGYQRIAIDDPRFDVDINLQEALKEETKKQALEATKDIMSNYSKNKRIENVQALNDVTKNIIDEILTNTTVGVDMSNIQSFDVNTYTHSFSVTILSLYLAKQIGLNKNQLLDIGIGGLLHDIGKLNVPLEILNKPDRLTPEEFDVIKRHPMDGFVQIKDRIPLLAAHIALQHHEKFDGTGYPRNLKGENIHIYGRICAVADVYDALTADRPYRSGMKPDKALKIIIESSGTHFDPSVVEALLKIISVYPNGTIVKLNNGDKGIVTAQNEGEPLHPILLIFEKNGIPLKSFSTINMKNQVDYHIIEVCNE